MTPLDAIDTPSIVLGGRTFAVPEFVVRQSIPFYKRLRSIRNVDFRKPIATFTDEEIDALYDVVHIALLGGEPKLTRAQFDELPITMGNIVDAMLIIYQQAGLILKTTETPPSGEAEAGSPSTSTP